MAEKPSEELVKVGETIANCWRVNRKLGEGGFGAVFEVQHTETWQFGALKIESVTEKNQVLKMEVAVLKQLQKEAQKKHCCKLLGAGTNPRYNYIIMSLLGKSLSYLKKAAKDHKFSLSTSLRVAFQCLEAIEEIQAAGFIHRDIKPSNFALGRKPDERTVFILDFGLCRKYISELTGVLRTQRETVGFRGTVRYAALTAHRHKEIGRHDDIWSLFHMMVEMIVGQLPWSKVTDVKEVGRMKETITTEDLCRGCPLEFQAFHKLLQTLEYEDDVPFAIFKALLEKAIKRNNVTAEDPFDWEPDAQKGQAGRRERTRDMHSGSHSCLSF